MYVANAVDKSQPYKPPGEMPPGMDPSIPRQCLTEEGISTGSRKARHSSGRLISTARCDACLTFGRRFWGTGSCGGTSMRSRGLS